MMDKDTTTIIRRKKGRGQVMCMLDNTYPNPVAYGVMERLLAEDQMVPPHELPGIITYLEDKRYIRVDKPDEPQLRPLQGAILELTAHGKDLLEGSLPEDVGILF